MNRVVKMFVAVAVVSSPLIASAQQGPLPQRVTKLERKTKRQDQKIRDLNLRIAAIEELIDGGGGSLPGTDLGVACMVQDSYHKKAYIGVADSQLDAEYKAYKACEAKSYSGYCSNGKLTCEVITSDSKSVCVVVDSYHKKRYRGQGDNELLAMANALQTCMKSAYSGYCANGKIQCEAVY